VEAEKGGRSADHLPGEGATAHPFAEGVARIEARAEDEETGLVERLAAALHLEDGERAALGGAADGKREVEISGTLLDGRTREVGEIRRHLGGLGPPVLMLSGEPGIGKTRLLEEAAARAAESEAERTSVLGLGALAAQDGRRTRLRVEG